MKLPRTSRLEIFILAALEPKERYGVEIVDAIKKATHGEVVVPLGGLYTVLERMEEKGFVTARWDDSDGTRRRYYSATALGELALAESRSVLLKTFRLATS